MAVDEVEAQIWQRFRSLLQSYANWRRTLQILFVLGGVILAGFSEALSNAAPDDSKPYLYAGWIFGLVLAFIGGIVISVLDDSGPDTLLLAQNAREKLASQDQLLDNLEADFRWLTRLYTINAVFREVIEQVAISGPGTRDDQVKRLGAMLDVLVTYKADLFGMSHDRWNFAIYHYNPKTKQLECQVCRRPVRAEEDAPHRSWGPGEGHVGLAFLTARPIIAGDTSEPEARALFDAPEVNRRDNDRQRYRSIASIPIRLQDEEPSGVLVATSDIVGRFAQRQREAERAQDSVEPLRALASSLAMLDRAIHFKCKGDRLDG